MSEQDFYYQMGRDASEEVYKPMLLSKDQELMIAKQLIETQKNKIEELLCAIETIDDCICNDREEEALMFISEILHKSVEEGFMEWPVDEEEEETE